MMLISNRAVHNSFVRQFTASSDHHQLAEGQQLTAAGVTVQPAALSGQDDGQHR